VSIGRTGNDPHFGNKLSADQIFHVRYLFGSAVVRMARSSARCASESPARLTME
jgi:hypothetical protein